MMNTPNFLSMNELIALTTIKTCPLCKEKHAAIRTCKEAELERQFVTNQ